MLSLGGLSCLAGSTWGANLLTIHRILQAVIIPQITYYASIWYIPHGERGHKKSHLKKLEMLQSKAARIITGAFRATSIPALNIEAYLTPMHHTLDKLVIESALQIAETPLYNLLLSTRRNQKNRHITPLETLIKRYEVRSGLSIDQLEKKLPYIVPPWWKSPHTCIKPSKEQAKSHHQQILERKNHLHNALFYTDGSGINGQIGAASALPAMNLTIRAYLGEAHLFTVYSGELEGILLALWTARDHLWLKTRILIFKDSQASIQAISNPGNQSGQSILVNIVTAIDSLRDQGKEVEFHWIPAHQEIEGNELADTAAKQATGWKKKRKRNGRIEERHDGKKAAQTQIPHLRSARSQANWDFVKKAWEDEWTSEKRGRDLRILTPSPSPHTLRSHTQIRKGYSAIITQMRTGKIGLRHLLCLRKVPGFIDPRFTCRNDNQTVRHPMPAGGDRSRDRNCSRYYYLVWELFNWSFLPYHLIIPSEVRAVQDVISPFWWITHLHPTIHQDPSWIV